jgi:hypothetical protein
MADQCVAPQELCSIFRGDTLAFKFTFTDLEEAPLNIAGKKLYFTMKLDPSSEDDAEGNLQYSVMFPNDYDSSIGLGTMIIPADVTADLIPNATYYYDFQYIDGLQIATIGSGTVVVKQDITKIGN